MLFADVAVPLGVDRTFTYRVPEGLGLCIGCRVLVPFRNRHLIGVVASIDPEAPPNECKEVIRILDSKPLFTRPLIDLALWIAAYYVVPLGEALRVMLPPGLLAKSASPDESPEEFWPVRKQRAVVELLSPGEASLTPLQEEASKMLVRQQLPVLVADVLREGILTASTLQALVRKGVVRVDAIDVHRSPWAQLRVPPVVRHKLTRLQQGVLEELGKSLASRSFSSSLIHGVTASGKTEVYLHLIERALDDGRSALVLVPEIGLTPQMSRQFRSWFGDRVAIQHSALSAGERFDQWRQIRKGEAAVVVGTRSAVFSPLQNLGLIVIDEEQDASYKQNDSPRYHARDTALRRGQLEGAMVVLGSATPQLETYHACVSRRLHRYVPMARRVRETPLPTVHIVDMRSEFEQRGKGVILSELLTAKIGQRLEARQQVIVHLNRRGYSRLLLCRSCGHVEGCSSCSISLTFHQESRRLSCHYCGYSRSVPSKCRECGRTYLYFLGEGTEKIQEELQMRFPRAVVDRLDRDSVQRKGRLERILGQFSAGKTDILVGTQMIAKGHDFPGVTLVGVLDAELGLKLADFRAAERTFQLMTQVAGRAGRRDQPGEVVIQTYYPNHYSLKYACTQDYLSFARQELEFRKQFRYPPYLALVSLLVRDRSVEKAFGIGRRLVQALVSQRDQVSDASRMRILGPAPAAIERIKNDFRIQVIIKSTSRREANLVVRKALADVSEERGGTGRLSVDVDPVSLL